jgi:hypothetical protein
LSVENIRGKDRRRAGGRLALGCAVAALCSEPTESLEAKDALEMRPGFELTVPIEIVEGRIVVGTARRAKLGAGQPREGELTVGVAPGGHSPYAQVSVVERTSAPLNFVATGFIGGTKIDEIVLCGRLGAPVSSKIAAGSWRIVLSQFEVADSAPKCP